MLNVEPRTKKTYVLSLKVHTYLCTVPIGIESSKDIYTYTYIHLFSFKSLYFILLFFALTILILNFEAACVSGTWSLFYLVTQIGMKCN